MLLLTPRRPLDHILVAARATATYSDGRVVSYSYNGEGQLHCVKETGGDSPATYLYTYDATGNVVLSEKKDANGNTLLRAYQNYDSAGQLVGQTWCAGNASYSEGYTYNVADGSLSTMTTATGETLQFGYDTLQRLTSVGNGLYTKNYSYRNLSDTRTTTQVAQLQYAIGSASLNYGYTYDALGNVATYSAPGKGTVTYTYDALGQLLSAVGDESYTYTYNSAGNILTANGHTYTYGHSRWRDLLTAYDGHSITYDSSGNPLCYYNGSDWNFTWENGRSLATAADGTTNISYAYDAGGLRTAKTVGSVTHNYLYASGQLLRETYGNNTLDFFYDAGGCPYALKYNGTTYYYITNLQGDVMYLVDTQGNTVASYDYDPYGNIVSGTGTMADINPLRYRGYYYDAELEMYYLQSRYYDPAIGRFINADDISMLGASGTVLGDNLFAYCNNNAINFVDSTGCIPQKVMNMVHALNTTAILSVFAYALYMTPAATLVKIGAYVTALLSPKVIPVFWYQPWVVAGIVAAAVAVVVTAVAVAHNKAVAKAHAKIQATVKKGGSYQYWSANLNKGCVDIGRPLTYLQAVAEVAAGRNVFTVTRLQAEAVARAAGGGSTPVLDPKHQNKIGYYEHYHIYGRANGAHVWYLF